MLSSERKRRIPPKSVGHARQLAQSSSTREVPYVRAVRDDA